MLTSSRSRKELILEKKFVLIKAEYIRHDEGVVTLKLVDGFGNAEVVADKDKLIPAK